MVSYKFLALSALAVLPLSLAAPAPVPETVNWVPFDEFNGQTVYRNIAIVNVGSSTPEKEAARSLERRDDRCNGATVNSHPQPFANTGDCIALRDWAARTKGTWSVRVATPDSHGLWYLGTCVFETGTKNVFSTWIGNENMRDIMTMAIDRWGSSGQLASTGETHCDNDGGVLGGTSAVKWTVKHS